MKKRQSLNPTKNSRKDSSKTLLVNKKLIIPLSIIFILICGYIIVTDSNPPESGGQISPNQTEIQASPYQISVIDNSTGGDVSNNTVLMENINKTPLINEIMEAAKNGTPMIKFGDGSSPRVMVVAGVHGAELPPQIAVSNLINYLSGKKINGTVYIIPFAIPNNTAHDERFSNGTDPDRVAQIQGTPLNVISNTSKNENVSMLVDFHSSQPNDVPGKNCIIYDPQNSKSLKLARYINSKTDSPLVVVGNYSGVLSTVSNRQGITSVVCEVLSPHGQVKPGSADLSYKYMITFLEYAGVWTPLNEKNNQTNNQTQ